MQGLCHRKAHVMRFLTIPITQFQIFAQKCTFSQSGSHIVTYEVILRVRELCYTGSFQNTKMKLAREANATDLASDSDSHKVTNQCHDLPAAKLADLKQMYSRFIQRVHWPEYVQ